LTTGRTLATAMGHRPLLAQIERELPRVAAERSGSELTATERRVADMIAAGATNRDAAAALFVSVRTIETHVASITASSACAPGPNWPGGCRPGLSSTTDTAPRRARRARQLSVRAADLPRA
jgi:DNA-binding CsgD family transcriptional regulator